MANRMPPLDTPGQANCCFQTTAAERRRWIAAVETLGGGIAVVARRLAALGRRTSVLPPVPRAEVGRRLPAAKTPTEGVSS
jgi:hypothetical protein